MTNKMTIRDYFNEVIELATANDRSDIVEFAESRIAVLDKKSANKKPTKTQEENESIKAEILGFLGTVDKAKVSDITKTLGDKVTSSQQVSALITQLKNEGKVTRFTEKKDIFFALVTE